MDFPITDLLDEDACYAQLVTWLHPAGLACPRCHQADRMRVHRSHRAPARDYRCRHCHRVFNAFTGTILQGTKRRPRELVLVVRGFAQGVPTARPRAGLRPRRAAEAAAPAPGGGLSQSGHHAAG